jgi:hypothetical protein
MRLASLTGVGDIPRQEHASLRLEEASGQSPLHDVKDVRLKRRMPPAEFRLLARDFFVVLPRFALLKDKYALK